MIETKHRGSHSEIVASAWLMRRGFEVFRALSAHGCFDLIARDPVSNRLYAIDVATMMKYETRGGVKKMSIAASKVEVASRNGGLVLMVDPDTGECVWNPDCLVNEIVR